jgi:glutathione S-transferase
VDDASAIEAMRAKVPQTMGACFRLIETAMFTGPWVLGNEYSVCDPYLFTVSNWLAGDEVDIREFPAIADHNDRMRERPAVETVVELHGL